MPIVLSELQAVWSNAYGIPELIVLKEVLAFHDRTIMPRGEQKANESFEDADEGHKSETDDGKKGTRRVSQDLPETPRRFTKVDDSDGADNTRVKKPRRGDTKQVEKDLEQNANDGAVATSTSNLRLKLKPPVIPQIKRRPRKFAAPLNFLTPCPWVRHPDI